MTTWPKVKHASDVAVDARDHGCVGNGVHDDTAAVQATITAAQTLGRTAYFPAGTYKITSSVTTVQGFIQPHIRGENAQTTFFSGTGAFSILRIKGGSGQLALSEITDITFTGVSTTVGIELAGCCGVIPRRVHFGTLSVGVLFHNDAASTFTEQCVVHDSHFHSGVTTDIEYRVTLGTASFHGSGFRDCLLNQSDAGNCIKIGSGAQVYNAPMDGCVFLDSTPQSPILHAGTIPALTCGSLRFENPSHTDITVVDAASTGIVYHVGTAQSMSQGVLGSAKFTVCSSAAYNSDGTVGFQPLPYSRAVAMVTGANTVVALPNAVVALVHVTFEASNYHYAYLLSVYRSPYDGTGTVTTLQTVNITNAAAYGAPTFSVSSGNLVATNASFPASGVTAKFGLSQMNGRATNPDLI